MIKNATPILLMIVILCFLKVKDGNAQYYFTNFNYTHGLPLVEINVIKEDSLGYIWLGGPEGIVRFNGSKFTNFQSANTNYILGGTAVNDIEVMPDGRVLILHEDNGISVYDYNIDSFSTKKYAPGDSLNFPKNSIFSCIAIDDSTAFVASHREGLYKLNLNTLISEKLDFPFSPKDMIKSRTHQNQFYFSENGVYIYKAVHDSIQKISDIGFAGLKYINNNLWFNTFIGQLFKYDFSTKTTSAYPTSFRGAVRGFELVGDDIWIGMAEGIEVMDTTTGKIINVIKAGRLVHDLPGTFVYKIYKDSQNRIWIATEGGLSLYSPKTIPLIPSATFEEQTTNLYKVNSSLTITLDYIETIITLHENKGQTTVDIEGGLVTPIEILNDGSDLIVLFYNGIGKLNLSEKRVIPIESPFNAKKERGLIDLKIIEGIYYGFFRPQQELIIWNPKNNQSKVFETKCKTLGTAILNQKEIALFGEYAIDIINIENQSLTSLPLISGNLAVTHNKVVGINRFEEYFFLSSERNGIFKTKYQGGNFEIIKQYDQHDGLGNSFIREAISDDSGNLYIQSRDGVFRYQPESDRFMRLHPKFAINQQKVEKIKVIDSTLHLLGFKNYTLNLQKFQAPKENAIFHFKKIEINGEKLESTIQKPISLAHNQNNIEVYFDFIYFTDPSALSSRYRLKNDAPWNYLPKGSDHIYLSSLSPGNYNFSMENTNGDSPWTEVLSFHLEINHPFWKSWWFIALLVALTALVGYILFKIRLNQSRKMQNLSLKLAELESKSLRAQMNPHFVFNALNSIKSFIIKNEREQAADYLNLFSDLIRSVLNNSMMKEITLDEELEALRLYIEIEKLRLRNKFTYEVEISKVVNPSTTVIPPLIIQPFVENSIWHGFINSKKECHLVIKVLIKADSLLILVRDNGIGRKASREIESNRKRKKSFGISLTETRLQNVKRDCSIIIKDLNANGIPSGTEVEISLPLKSINREQKIESYSGR